MAHGIVRTDLMHGADVGAELVSVRFYNADVPAEIDNGCVVVIGALEDGQREVRKATAPTADADIREIALIASPEVIYDERLHDLSDFTNEAGTIARGYRLHSGDIFSVTKECLIGEETPEKGHIVELAADTKWNVATSATGGATTIGEIFDIETKNGITYYAILVKPTAGK